MGRNVSIVASLADRISPAVKSISGAFKSLNKDSDEARNKINALQTKQSELIKTQAQLKTNITEANKAVKEATKAFTASGDAISKANLDKANEKYLSLTERLKSFREEAKRTSSEIRGLQTEQSKLSNTADGGIGGALMKAGFGRMLGEAMGQASMAYFTSAHGTPAGDALAAIVSGAITGAAMGSVIPGVGTVGGAAIGTAAGVINAGTQVYSAQDDAFKSVRNQMVDEQNSRLQSDISAGSGIAAQRQLDAIAFTKLIGSKETAETYLEWVKDTANSTPLLYDDLKTMSKTLATYGYSPEDMQKRLIQIGDTGSALGMNTQDMSMVATGLGRMKSSGKTSLEYLNLLVERGIPAIDYLAEAMGATNAEVYDMVSRGLIPGAKAADAIADAMGKANSGAMAEMAETFSGMTSTVAGLKQEVEAAAGEGYNKEREKSLRAEIYHLSGENGERAKEANNAIGAYYASLENKKDSLRRRAEKKAYAEIDKLGLDREGAEAGKILMEARAKAAAEYNASDGAQNELKMQEQLIGDVTSMLVKQGTYWNTGYLLAQEQSKGMAAGLQENTLTLQKQAAVSISGAGERLESGTMGWPEWATFNGDSEKSRRDFEEYKRLRAAYAEEDAGKYAYGLSYVPYDNFPALLHEGEQVLTAGEARKNSDGGVTIPKLAETLVIREEADIYKIAQEIAREIINAQMLS